MIFQVTCLKKLDQGIIIGLEQEPIIQIVFQDFFDIVDAVAQGIGMEEHLLSDEVNLLIKEDIVGQRFKQMGAFLSVMGQELEDVRMDKAAMTGPMAIQHNQAI